MHAPVASWRLAAVLLSSSPGGARRTRGRGSKGEAFVTRQRYEHPLAGAAGRPSPRVHSHRTQRSTQGNVRPRGHRCGHGTAARRAPPRAAGTSSIGSEGRSPAPGMRKAGHRPVPAGDERGGANLQPPGRPHRGPVMPPPACPRQPHGRGRQRHRCTYANRSSAPDPETLSNGHAPRANAGTASASDPSTPDFFKRRERSAGTLRARKRPHFSSHARRNPAGAPAAPRRPFAVRTRVRPVDGVPA